MRAFGRARWVRLALAAPRAAPATRSISVYVANGSGYAPTQVAVSRSACRALSSASRSAFTSSHFVLDDPQEVPQFLGRKKLASKETDTHYMVRECPFCHATRGKADNLFKLYVHKASGVYKCHRCGAAGSWFDFKRKLQHNVAVSNSDAMLNGADHSHSHSHAAAVAAADEIKVIQVLDNAKAMAIQKNLLEEPTFKPVLDYLINTRGLRQDVLEKYCVGAIEQPFRDDQGDHVAVQCVSFPWMARAQDLNAMGVVRNSDEDNVPAPSAAAAASGDQNQFDVVRLKIRGVEDKSKQRLIPKGGSWGLFGWNTVPVASDEIVLTEGEFDAMAVYQATGLPAVSLPNGCQSLPPNVLPLLERFKRIYLWMDNDLSGQANVEKFAAKLGSSRCYIVRPSVDAPIKPKDANEALLSGVDLQEMILSAERMPHSQIATFEQLRREVFEEIVNPLRACGVQSRTMPALNRLLKGHRMGEVTVLTGPTGCGKTTLLSQLSLDLCGQGVNTLWGSFEIKNTRLIHKMLTQLAGKSLQGDVNAFNRTADEFEALPMYFLRFFGSTEVDEVLDAMEYAVYAYDVQHILLDNVQFMMAGQGRGFDKFERQDAALDKFRRFASQKNVHLTLVIHPRKEQDDVDLTLSSVFGTAKATQEADNVLILQRTHGSSKLDVRKNRFDGTLGSVPLKFDLESNCLRELNPEPMSDDLSAIDIEAQMALDQKKRQKVNQRAAAHSMDLEQEMAASQWEYSDMEPQQPRTVSYQMSAHDTKGVNGALSKPRSKTLNGLNGSSPSGSDDKKPNGLNGSTNKGPNGLNGTSRNNNGGGGEPFAAFTQIITR